ncbi:DUF2946 domain-containing protein [Erwinia sp. P6884]|uniref:DUF2946 domain-containing protein n=1 Tax=Erwinia sp. P6884 TaxID=3141450 RepID=UPI003188E269
MLSRLSQRRIPALVALMAILMLFIAPEVSKTLEHGRMQSDTDATVTAPASHAMHSMDMDGMHMAGMPEHHPISSLSPGDEKGQTGRAMPALSLSGSMGMMDDFACGYCQLLAHFPVLAWILIPVISLLLLISRVSSPLFTSVIPLTFFPGISQPRAPPVICH